MCNEYMLYNMYYQLHDFCGHVSDVCQTDYASNNVSWRMEEAWPRKMHEFCKLLTMND